MSQNDSNANANANANNGENEEGFIDMGDQGNGDQGDQGQGDQGQNNSNNNKPVETDEQRLSRFQRMTNQTRKKMGLDPIDFDKKAVNKKGKDNSSSENSEGLDFAQKAYMNSLGFKGQDLYDLAFEAMQSSGKSLDQILDAKWFQEDMAALATKKAMPQGNNGRSNNTVATDDPEYWVKKGEMPPNTPENQELRRKVVNAKIAKGKTGNKFSSNPVVGSM